MFLQTEDAPVPHHARKFSHQSLLQVRLSKRLAVAHRSAKHITSEPFRNTICQEDGYKDVCMYKNIKH